MRLQMTIVKIKARIRLNDPRKVPFYSGFMPCFEFFPENPDSKIGGLITLLDRDKFFPGDEASVEITYGFREFLGNELYVGKKFTFSEGTSTPIGEGSVEKILEE